MGALKDLKKEKFANFLVGGLSKKDSAIKAGYSAKTAASQGSRLSKEEQIIERVCELKNDQLRELGFDKLYITTKLKKAIEHLEVLSTSSKDDFNKINATVQLIKTLKEFHMFFDISSNFENTEDTLDMSKLTDAELDKMIKKFGGK